MAADTPSPAAEITKRSGSNLAIALHCLPRERRDDMVAFYAFCRDADDIADDPAAPAGDKRARLARWSEVVRGEIAAPTPLEAEVLAVFQKYGIDPALPQAIIEGVSMDLEARRYETFDDLLAYCYKVASAVGLVSIEIFGYQNDRCRAYAVDLGYALQITNIMRDVGHDFREDRRIYLPHQDFQEFGYTEADLAQGVENEAFALIMERQYRRATDYFEKAAAELPPEDRRSMAAAQMMGKTYRRLLEKMRAGGFRVLNHRYRVSKLRKLAYLAAAFVQARR